MKQIANALSSYQLTHGEFPPAYTTDKNGKPLHSWRTLILPHLDEQEFYEARDVYRKIDLSKPWDDPVNAEARQQVVELYRCPASTQSDNRTNYLAVVTPSSFLLATAGRQKSAFWTARNVITIIEVDEERAVPWMQPTDADAALLQELTDPSSVHPHPVGLMAAFADGHVEVLPQNLSNVELQKRIEFAATSK